MSETYGRDTRGRLITLRQRAWFGGEQRTTSYQYEDADGVYVTTTTNPQGFTHRDWRHVGLGLVVRSDDENGQSTTFTYDTFGRKKSVLKPTGERTTFSYSDPAGADWCGSESTTYPENRVSRAVRTRVDALGNETERSFSINDTSTVTVRTSYDRAGRAARTDTYSSTNPSPLAYRTTTYDDMNRVLDDCYGGFDALPSCKTNVYDGLTTTTTNEAGRVITHLGDAFGRISITRASLPAGVSNATFTYGPFGLLRQEKTAEASGQAVGQTDLVYDVLGRQTSMTRTGAGTRETSYNSFGDIVGTAKVAQDGVKSGILSYGRDALGRLTAITGSGMNRRLWWDTPASNPNVPAPNAKGKLVDLVDGATVHFDYYPSGLLQKKTWSAAVWGSMTEIGSVSYNYDGQGRPYMVTYPKVPNWSSPLTLVYDYDPFAGDVSAITNVTTGEPLTQIWAATGRDELGRIYRETMGVAGGPSIERQTYGYYASGMTNTASLIGTNGDATLVYTYDGDKLPRVFRLSGSAMGGGWNSNYTYDNLKRLTDWTTGTATVHYGYDADGNLTSRSWGVPGAGSTVTYTTAPSGTGAYERRLTSTLSSSPSYEDRYRADAWGRIYDTPAIALTYNAADEVVGATEKSNGQAYSIYRDAQGSRVVTTYGNPSNGQPWAALYTFDDLTEYKNSSSGVEERSRIRANGKLVGELVRTSDVPSRTANFYLVDNVGNVLAETAPSGVVTARARRDPYGNFMANALTPHLPREPLGANQDGSGRLGFGDHPRENNWGLVDMQARFYNPALGRFTTADPIVGNLLDRRSHNAFAYVRNNPVSGSDPMGLSDNMSEDSSQGAAAVCAAYGNYEAADTYKKKRLDTGLMSDFGGMSSVDDGDGGTPDVGSIVQTMADDLASYDPAVPRRRSGGAASSSAANPVASATASSGDWVDSLAGPVETADHIGDWADFGSGVGMKVWESSYRGRSAPLRAWVRSTTIETTAELRALAIQLYPESRALRTTTGVLRYGVGPAFMAIDGVQVGIALHQGNTYKAISSGIDFTAGGFALFVPAAGLPIAGGILIKREMEAFVEDTATRVHTDFTNMYQPNPGGWNVSPMAAAFRGLGF
jgi:RHS repeat-associated protein